ncbi:MAG: citramalate synthase [Spirochaetaceae bacterium]|nr:citramalate synthase [Spirochaetaceae bacterium]MBQ7905985.1 citramalate synthase [Spirochaetaceae bacterium]
MCARTSFNVNILDSTLRDGSQGEGISFSVQDKLHIVQALDELGVKYIEAGNPGSNPKDLEFFEEAKKLSLQNSQIVAFGATRRKGITCEEDSNLQSLLYAGTQTVVIFGKSWDFQVTDILKATLEENLAMIKETVEFLVANGRNVIYDAEHFFDAWYANPEYTLKTLKAAVEGGANILALCDTKGGTMPMEILKATTAVTSEFSGVKTPQGLPVEIGIHTHNDAGLAVANSLMAVEAGASHIQGTLLGFGERTGNANLSSIISNLELKMNVPCLPEGKLKLLTSVCKQVAEVSNLPLENGMPYVGSNAFAHKAGMHIDAVTKNPTAYEHVSPETVGNDRVFLMSEVAGRATILEKIRKFDAGITKDNPVVSEIVTKMKEMEHNGYQFEGAEGSFELMVRKIIGKYRPFFKLHYYKTIGEQPRIDGLLCSFAQLKIEVDGQLAVTAGEGDGPVHALDTALRSALERFYPTVSTIRLTDYKVRVLDSKSATGAKVRVLIETTDGLDIWTTVGVSTDIIEASWLALVDSFEYKLIRDIEKKYKNYI